MNDTFGNRMKSYERAAQTTLPPRTYTIIRVDGRAFHTYLKGAKKPFDPSVIRAMDETAVYLCQEMGGARFAYTQSDEISILLTDLNPRSEAWFSGEVQKLASVSASMATGAFNNLYEPGYVPGRVIPEFATFDARVYTIPSRIEVANYFLWRQKDAIRNAVSMAASAQFSQPELNGKNVDVMQEMLFQEHGINFKTEYTDRQRRGGVVVREGAIVPATVPAQYAGDSRRIDTLRHSWMPYEAPDFSLEDGSFLGDHIPGQGTGPGPSDIVHKLGSTALAGLFRKNNNHPWVVDQVFEIFGAAEDEARAWLVGTNPFLDDQSPLLAILANRGYEVIKAARTHIIGEVFS